MNLDTQPKINVIGPKKGLDWPRFPKISPTWVVAATVVLAIISVISAVLLYQRRQESVAPTAGIPSQAAVGTSCTIAFNVTASPTPTPSPSSTPTPSPTPTGTPDPTPTPTTTPTPTPTPSPSPLPTPTPTGTPQPTPTPTPIVSGPTPTSTPVTIVSGPTPTPVELAKAGDVTGTWTISIAGILLLGLGSLLMLAF